jgi:hypothetical protein
VDEAAIEEAATDDGAALLAGAIEDAGFDAGVDPPPPPPPPPQAVINPLKVTARRNLDLFINRSYLLSDLIADTTACALFTHLFILVFLDLYLCLILLAQVFAHKKRGAWPRFGGANCITF